MYSVLEKTGIAQSQYTHTHRYMRGTWGVTYPVPALSGFSEPGRMWAGLEDVDACRVWAGLR